MRVLACAIVASFALAACSQQEPAPSPVGGETSTAPPAATQADRKASTLTGTISPLNSGISGLNLRVTDTGTIIDLAADTLFEFDRADLAPGATEQLEKSAQMIRAAPPGPIAIVGHTDSKGDDSYNQRLSEARARTVADWFSRQVGARHRQFDVSGLGETAPIAPEQTADGQDDPSGRAKNRRVEVILSKG